jgi:hypothetical protein
VFYEAPVAPTGKIAFLTAPGFKLNVDGLNADRCLLNAGF